MWRTRPAVTARPFKRLTHTPIVLPITTGGNFARTAGFTVPLDGAGLKTTGVVRCDQPRALDLGSRHARKLDSVSPAVIDEVMAASVGRGASDRTASRWIAAPSFWCPG